MRQLSGRFSDAFRSKSLLRLETAALALVAVAMTVAVVRAPFVVRDFDHRAAFNDRRAAIDRTIAGADGVGIDNLFLKQALALVPAHAPYALEEPESADVATKDYGIVSTTYLALPHYVEYLMLPRRLVAPDRARYVLCYACNTDPFDPHWRRVWQSPSHGLVIGELNR
jgi:hypothetical protein